MYDVADIINLGTMANKWSSERCIASTALSAADLTWHIVYGHCMVWCVTQPLQAVDLVANGGIPLKMITAVDGRKVFMNPGNTTALRR